MPAITQNKLTPVFAICALVIVAYVLWGRYAGGTPQAEKSGAALSKIPSVPGENAPVQGGGLFGVGALNAPPRRADADSPSETLKTVTASNNELREKVQKVIDANEILKQENAKLQNNQAAIVAQVTERVLAEQKLASTVPSTPGTTPSSPMGQQARPSAIGGIVDAATGGYDTMVKSLGSPALHGIPSGLGYDSTDGAPTRPIERAASNTSYVRQLPVGYKEAKASDGAVRVVDARGAPVESHPSAGIATRPASEPLSDDRKAEVPLKKKAKPYYTIPENATMTRATLMTALVGRVPIDGKVQDPMQFKILIGKDNLAANGHQVPDAIAGIVISGVAVGDMALSCSEGLVQSLTFIFDDGSIKTVSMKRDGASLNFGGASGSGASGQAASVSQSNKLAWISDEWGNPCIDGKFVTNAPAYLTDMVGLKTLSIAAQASALAQTTTSSNPLGSTTAVTGNKNAYVLGQAAGAGVNEVSNWIMRRLNNSFDAVVTPAGGRIVVHFEQEISIDKGPDSRRLQYGSEQNSRLNARQLLD